MTNGKSGNQYQYLFQVFVTVNGNERQNKKLMIQSINADNMFPTQFKIKDKIL